jgi:hypothetical protein
MRQCMIEAVWGPLSLTKQTGWRQQPSEISTGNMAFNRRNLSGSMINQCRRALGLRATTFDIILQIQLNLECGDAIRFTQLA